MATNHNYQQLNLKNKLSKQQNRNSIINTEIIWRVISWEGERRE